MTKTNTEVILLDQDDTVVDTSTERKKATRQMLNYLSQKTSLPLSELEPKYNQASRSTENIIINYRNRFNKKKNNSYEIKSLFH